MTGAAEERPSHGTPAETLESPAGSLILRVTGAELVGTDLARVTFHAQASDGAEGDARRAAAVTLIVPLAEAQTFYVVGTNFDLGLTPHAEDPRVVGE